MTSYTEMLEQPQIITKVESLLSGHIMAVYIKAGYNPPVPMLHDNRFIYADPASEKYARRLREGMKLFAELLDQLESNNEATD